MNCRSSIFRFCHLIYEIKLACGRVNVNENSSVCDPLNATHVHSCRNIIACFFSSLSFGMRARSQLQFQLNLNNSNGKRSGEHVRQNCCNRLNLADKLISIVPVIIIGVLWVVLARSRPQLNMEHGTWCEKPPKSSGTNSTTCIRFPQQLR